MITFRAGRKRDEILSLFKPGTKLIIFDTETTGLNPNDDDRIIEFSAMRYIVKEDMVLERVDAMQQYIKPPFLISDNISNLTGITNGFLADKPTEDTVAEKIYDYLSPCQVFSGHNVSFDIRFVNAMFQRNHLPELSFGAKADTCALAKDIISKDVVENFKLATLLAATDNDKGIKFHSAIDDVFATSLLLSTLLQQYKAQATDAEELMQLNVESVAPWSKYGRDRIYVNTDKGSVFFEGADYVDSKQVDITRVDVDKLKQDAMRLIGAASFEEFLAYKGVTNNA